MRKGPSMRRLVIVGAALALAIVGCKNNLPAKPKPGETVTYHGEIKAGAECPLLIVEPNRRFSLSGDLRGFKVGDKVCVRGTVAEMSICMAGEATIAVSAIAPENNCP